MIMTSTAPDPKQHHFNLSHMLDSAISTWGEQARGGASGGRVSARLQGFFRATLRGPGMIPAAGNTVRSGVARADVCSLICCEST